MLQWLQDHLLPCAYKAVFGIECPACGFQRSFLLLMQGRWADSFTMYPPLIPVLLLLVFFIIRPLSRKKIHVKYMYRFAACVLAIVMINYCVKLFFLQ